MMAETWISLHCAGTTISNNADLETRTNRPRAGGRRRLILHPSPKNNPEIGIQKVYDKVKSTDITKKETIKTAN